MKKIGLRITVLSIIFVILASFSVCALDATLLEKADILSGEYSGNETVTREMFAHAIAHMKYPDNTFEPCDTVFDDVKADNLYSGEINILTQNGILSGIGNGMFNPKGSVTCEQVAKVLVSVLGYDEWGKAGGGYPQGYMNVASDLELFNGADLSNGVTVSVLRTMLLNALKTPVPDMIVYTNDDNYFTQLLTNKDNPSYAEKYLSLYEYEVKVKSVSIGKFTVTAEIVKNNGTGQYNQGDNVVFYASANLEIKSFEDTYAKIITDKNDNIVDISLAKKVQVKYGVVDSVNNTTSLKPFYTDHLSTLTLKDDELEYDFAEGFTVKLNEEVYHGKINLMNKYVKLVTYDDMITCIETWDLKDGGIFGEIDFNNLYYRDGNIESRISDLLDYSEIYVIIDGESRNKKELKEGCIFSYYMNDDTGSLVIVATEKKVTEKLKSINASSKKLNLGSLWFTYADKFYVQKDGTYYEGNTTTISSLFNKDVNLHFDIYSNVKYITSSDDVKTNDLVGCLVGIQQDSFGEVTVRIFDIEDDEAILKDYILKEKVQYEDGLTKEDFLASADSDNEFEIFEFTITSKNEISQIKRPHKFEGFATAETKPSIIPDRTTYIYIQVDGRNLYFENDTPIIAIFKEDNAYKIRRFTYEAVRGAYCSDVTMKFYGYIDSSEVRFITLTGNISEMTTTLQEGVLTNVNMTMDKYGNDAYSVTIDGNEYTVSKENGDSIGIHKNMIVDYGSKLLNRAEIKINGAIDISDSFDNWAGRKNGRLSLKAGTVKRADNKRVVFEDGTDYFFDPREHTVYKCSGNGKFAEADFRDLIPGTNVVLALVSNEITVAIAE